MVQTQSKYTLVVNEDVTVESVPEQQDIVGVFKVDVCSGEQVGIQAAKREERSKGCQHFHENQLFFDIVRKSYLLITFDQLKRTRNSQKMEVD